MNECDHVTPAWLWYVVTVFISIGVFGFVAAALFVDRYPLHRKVSDDKHFKFDSNFSFTYGPLGGLEHANK